MRRRRASPLLPLSFLLTTVACLSQPSSAAQDASSSSPGLFEGRLPLSIVSISPQPEPQLLSHPLARTPSQIAAALHSVRSVVTLTNDEPLQIVFNRAVIALGSDFPTSQSQSQPASESPTDLQGSAAAAAVASGYPWGLPVSMVPIVLPSSLQARARWVTTFIFRLDPVSDSWPCDLSLNVTWNPEFVTFDGARLPPSSLPSLTIASSQLSLWFNTVLSPMAVKANRWWHPTVSGNDAPEVPPDGTIILGSSCPMDVDYAGRAFTLHASNGSPLPHLSASVSSCQSALSALSSSLPTATRSLYLPPGGDQRCIAVRIVASSASPSSSSSASLSGSSSPKHRGLAAVRQLASDEAAGVHSGPVQGSENGGGGGVDVGSSFLLSILPGRHYHPQAGAVKSATSVHLHGLYPFRFQRQDRGGRGVSYPGYSLPLPHGLSSPLSDLAACMALSVKNTPLTGDAVAASSSSSNGTTAAVGGRTRGGRGGGPGKGKHGGGRWKGGGGGGGGRSKKSPRRGLQEGEGRPQEGGRTAATTSSRTWGRRRAAEWQAVDFTLSASQGRSNPSVEVQAALQPDTSYELAFQSCPHVTDGLSLPLLSSRIRFRTAPISPFLASGPSEPLIIDTTHPSSSSSASSPFSVPLFLQLPGLSVPTTPPSSTDSAATTPTSQPAGYAAAAWRLFPRQGSSSSSAGQEAAAAVALPWPSASRGGEGPGSDAGSEGGSEAGGRFFLPDSALKAESVQAKEGSGSVTGGGGAAPAVAQWPCDRESSSGDVDDSDLMSSMPVGVSPIKGAKRGGRRNRRGRGRRVRADASGSEPQHFGIAWMDCGALMEGGGVAAIKGATSACSSGSGGNRMSDVFYPPGSDAPQLVGRTSVSVVVTERAEGVMGEVRYSVWVTGMSDGRPVEGAKAEVAGPKWLSDGVTIIASAVTDADGLALLPPLSFNPEDGSRCLLIVTHTDSSSVVPLFFNAQSSTQFPSSSSSSSSSSSFLPSFQPAQPSTPPLVACVLDRAVYRPGDSVHVYGVMKREERDKSVRLPDLATVFFNLPDGTSHPIPSFVDRKFGSFLTTFRIPSSSQTGYVSLHVEDTSSYQAVGFTIADPRPPTALLQLTVPTQVAIVGATTNVTLAARTYLGAGVEGASVQLKWRTAVYQGRGGRFGGAVSPFLKGGRRGGFGGHAGSASFESDVRESVGMGCVGTGEGGVVEVTVSEACLEGSVEVVMGKEGEAVVRVVVSEELKKYASGQLDRLSLDATWVGPTRELLSNSTSLPLSLSTWSLSLASSLTNPVPGQPFRIRPSLTVVRRDEGSSYMYGPLATTSISNSGSKARGADITAAAELAGKLPPIHISLHAVKAATEEEEGDSDEMETSSPLGSSSLPLLPTPLFECTVPAALAYSEEGQSQQYYYEDDSGSTKAGWDPAACCDMSLPAVGLHAVRACVRDEAGVDVCTESVVGQTNESLASCPLVRLHVSSPQLEKSLYRVGDTARMHFHCPYEQATVLLYWQPSPPPSSSSSSSSSSSPSSPPPLPPSQHRIVSDIRAGNASLEFPVTEDCAGVCSVLMVLVSARQSSPPFPSLSLLPVSVLADLSGPQTHSFTIHVPVEQPPPPAIAIKLSVPSHHVVAGQPMDVSLSLDHIPSHSDSVQLLLAVVDKAFLDLEPCPLADLETALSPPTYLPAVPSLLASSHDLTLTPPSLAAYAQGFARRKRSNPWAEPTEWMGNTWMTQQGLLASSCLASQGDPDPSPYHSSHASFRQSAMSASNMEMAAPKFMASSAAAGARPLLAAARTKAMTTSFMADTATAGGAAGMGGAPSFSSSSSQLMTISRSNFTITPFFATKTVPVSRGQAVTTVTIAMPDSLSEFVIRAYAVGSGASRFGSTEAHVVSSRPLALVAAIPRIVRVGDEVMAGVTVSLDADLAAVLMRGSEGDLSGGAEVQVSVVSEAGVGEGGEVAVQVVGDASKTVRATGHGPVEIRFSMKAVRVGATRLRFTATAPSLPNDVLLVSLEVHGLQPPVSVATSMAIRATPSPSLSAAALERLALPADILPGSASLNLSAGVGHLPAILSLSHHLLSFDSWMDLPSPSCPHLVAATLPSTLLRSYYPAGTPQDDWKASGSFLSRLWAAITGQKGDSAGEEGWSEGGMRRKADEVAYWAGYMLKDCVSTEGCGILPYSSKQQQQQPSYLPPSSTPSCTFDVRLNSLALLFARYSALIAHTPSPSPSSPPSPTVNPALLGAWRAAMAAQFSLLQQRHMLVKGGGKRVGRGKAGRFGKRVGRPDVSEDLPGSTNTGSTGGSAGMVGYSPGFPGAAAAGDAGAGAFGGMMGGMEGAVSGSSGAMMGTDMMGGESSSPGFEGSAAGSTTSSTSTGTGTSSSSSGGGGVTPERGLYERLMVESWEMEAGVDGEHRVSGVEGEEIHRSAAVAAAAVAGEVPSIEQSVPISREATLPIGHVHTFFGNKPIDAPVAAADAVDAVASSAAVASSLPSAAARIGTVNAAVVTQPVEIGPADLSYAVDTMGGGGVTTAPDVDLGVVVDGSGVGAPTTPLLLPYFSWDDVPYFLLALTPSGVSSPHLTLTTLQQHLPSLSLTSRAALALSFLLQSAEQKQQQQQASSTTSSSPSPALPPLVDDTVSLLLSHLHAVGRTAFLSLPGTRSSAGLHANALALLVLVEAGSDSPLVSKLANHVAAGEQSTWPSMMDMALASLALSRYDMWRGSTQPDLQLDVSTRPAASPSSPSSLQATSPTSSLLSAAFSPSSSSPSLVSLSLPWSELGSPPPQDLLLAARGRGEVSVSLSMDFVPSKLLPFPTYRGIYVEKMLSIFSSSPSPQDPAIRSVLVPVSAVPVGSIVEVTLQFTLTDDCNNVILLDLPPAGLEPLDDQLLQQGGGGGGQQRMFRNYDDIMPVSSPSSFSSPFSLLFFRSPDVTTRPHFVRFHYSWLPAGTHSVSYTAMSATPGSYSLPPAKAYLQEQPEVLGLSAAGKFWVLGEGESAPPGVSEEEGSRRALAGRPKRCPDDCSHAGTCNVLSGQCICDALYSGPSCNTFSSPTSPTGDDDDTSNSNQGGFTSDLHSPSSSSSLLWLLIAVAAAAVVLGPALLFMLLPSRMRPRALVASLAGYKAVERTEASSELSSSVKVEEEGLLH